MDRREMMSHCPALATLLKDHAILPPQWLPCFEELFRLASKPETDFQEHKFRSTVEYQDDRYVYAPYLQKVRQSLWVRSSDTAVDACTKRLLKDNPFTPGIFTFSCPHSIALGFYVMDEYESVETAFRILYERFQVAPGLVIYDNACNLSKYAMRRSPLFFAKTRFMIDRVHFRGHVACHKGYSMDAHPGMMVMGGKLALSYINSQVAEQLNSRLLNVKKSASHMNEDNFRYYIRLYIAFINEDHRKKLLSI